MLVVVLAVLVVELVAAVLLLLAARRTRARLHELEQARSALGAEAAGLPAAAPGNPLLSVEILNAAEVAARQSWAARTFGSFAPRMVVREVATRAAEQMGRQLEAQGVAAEVRVVAPALPGPASAGEVQPGGVRAVAGAALDEQIAQMVVEAGTTSARDLHHTIADIPLDVLAALPATRAAAERVRAVHDPIADGVYDAISLVTKATGSVLRALRGDREQR